MPDVTDKEPTNAQWFSFSRIIAAIAVLLVLLAIASLLNAIPRPVPAASSTVATSDTVSSNSGDSVTDTYNTSNDEPVPNGGNPCSATYGDPQPPTPWRIATTTGITATLQDNNLLVNGKEIVSNIPDQFGLKKADGVGLEDFFTWYATGPSCDYYSPIVISPDNTEVAFLYGRFASTTAPLQTAVSVLLVYSLDGKLLYKSELNYPPTYGQQGLHDPSTGDPSFFGADAIVIDYSSGKEGDNGSPVLYFFDGHTVTLPDGAYVNGTFSPDHKFLLYTGQEDITSCDGLQSGGMGSYSMSALRLFDISTATSTLIRCDTTRAFIPLGWSRDSQKAIVLVEKSVGENQFQSLAFDSFLIFDNASKTLTPSKSTDTLSTLKSLCDTTYDCSDDYWVFSQLGQP